MIIKNKKLFTSILLMLISFVCVAHELLDGVVQDLPFPEIPEAVPPPGLPIDSELIIGIVFALLYGAIKIITFKRFTITS